MHRRASVWRWCGAGSATWCCIQLIGVVTAFFGTIALVLGVWDKNGRLQHATLARMWARVMLRIAFCPVTVEHAERLPLNESAVYACNHLSYYDTPALFAKLPFQFRIIAKAPLWKIPFVGMVPGAQRAGAHRSELGARGCGEPVARREPR
jgi:1-acyl-sn-glycerol-3-phosphate acyltransferase